MPASPERSAITTSCSRIAAVFLIAAGAGPVFCADVLEISRSTRLDPSRTYGAIRISASDVTLDGAGAWLVGATEGDPKTFKGAGISAKGVSGVVIRNLNARGFETGLRVEDGEGWRVEGCDFSDNFHDPAFGWGENGRRGGIVLTRVNRSTLRKNRANRVWDGCVLVGSDGNTIEENDFSRASNTCLKLWNSSENIVRRNNLSYGIRISPGEVHARDSTSVLIESGSNRNRFIDNDCTHGGDGIFIRVLNGWVSTDNLFEGNDCSFANNNCFEAWSPRNTYIRNRANGGSYGFWLGASDQTVLIDNEASGNGDPQGIHNSPHLPGNGHAGIVFMFGPSSHTIARGNRCIGNNGAGIALVGDLESAGKKWRAFHWIIEENTLEENRWGIYIKNADWVDIAANRFRANREGDIRDDGGVANLTRRPDDPRITRPPRAVLEGPSAVRVGAPVIFDASASADPESNPLIFRWDLGDGTVSAAPRVEHVFRAPGFYRLGLTVNNGLLSDLAWRDLYAVEDLVEIGTEGDAAGWDWVDPSSRARFTADRAVKISGECSTFARVDPYGGGRVSLRYPRGRDAGWRLEGKTSLVFWLKTINEHVPAWQDVNPIVTLHESEEKLLRLRPKGDFLSSPPYIEAREGWAYFTVPLAGDDAWQREGEPIDTANWLTIGLDSWGAPPLSIWLDGLALQ